MLIPGCWLLCDDRAVRPVIRGDVRAGDGSWQPAEFLVDTGADCTVLSAQILNALGLVPAGAAPRLEGLGGAAASVVVATVIRLTLHDGGQATFNGQFAATTDLRALDLSVLGQDILRLFAVIVDRERDVVCLLRPPHRYTITSA